MTDAVAVIGCGYWGKNLVRNFAELRALRMICDQDPKVLQSAATYPDVVTTRQFDDVVRSPDVRGVVIATPADQHHRQAKAAMLAGKDVFVEKPLALEYAGGRELVELAAAQDVVLMVGHVLEYHPAVTTLTDLLHRGELGKTLYVYSNRLNLGRVRQVENILWSLLPMTSRSSVDSLEPPRQRSAHPGVVTCRPGSKT